MHAHHNHKYCVKDAMQLAESICSQKGLRFTGLRRTVLEMVWAGHRPVKAYDILDKLKDKRASAKPPTVYRTLDFLLENGLIHRLNSLNAYVGCSHPQKCSECYFLICSECGEVKECCNPTLAKAIVGTTSKNKFSPKYITLEIEGKCEDCKK